MASALGNEMGKFRVLRSISALYVVWGASRLKPDTCLSFHPVSSGERAETQEKGEGKVVEARALSAESGPVRSMLVSCYSSTLK